MTRLGFLGAMNRDVVVRQSAAVLLPRLGIDAAPLLETHVSDVLAQRGAELLHGMAAETWLGGSAFNAARVAALLNRDRSLDVAFFGIAGTVDGGSPHLSALTDWGVDTSGVENVSLPPATCLAMVEPAGRTLLTASGANAGVLDWLDRNQTGLVEAIAQCDLLHVTSFLDPAAPGRIAVILEQARMRNPALRISLDPGIAWLAAGGEGFDRLLRQAGILHLNAEEFAALGGGDAVPAIGARLAPDWLILARAHAGATLYADAAGDPIARSLPDQPPPIDFIAVDATGAGDTFCGGFLWAYCADSAQPLAAAALGFALARAKVGVVGPITRSGVEDVLRAVQPS